MLIRSRGMRISLVLLVTVLVLGYLVSQADMGTVLASLLAVQWLPWLAALAVFLGGHLLRYFRYALIWQWRPDLRSFSVTAWHGVASYLLPMRLGELVLPALARRLGGQDFVTALFGLIWLRLLDLLVVLLLAGGFLLLSFWRGTEVIPVLWWPEAHSLLSLWRWPLTWLVLLVLVLAALLIRWILARRLGLAACPRSQARVLMLSVLIWLAVLLMNTLLASSLGVQLTPQLVVWLLIGATFAYAIPLQGVGGLGGHQLVWYAVLVAVPVSANDALALSVSSHVLTLLWILVLAAIAALVWWRAASARH